jgi:hypothetical protein
VCQEVVCADWVRSLEGARGCVKKIFFGGVRRLLFEVAFEEKLIGVVEKKRQGAEGGNPRAPCCSGGILRLATPLRRSARLIHCSAVVFQAVPQRLTARLCKSLLCRCRCQSRLRTAFALLYSAELLHCDAGLGHAMPLRIIAPPCIASAVTRSATHRRCIAMLRLALLDLASPLPVSAFPCLRRAGTSAALHCRCRSGPRLAVAASFLASQCITWPLQRKAQLVAALLCLAVAALRRDVLCLCWAPLGLASP